MGAQATINLVVDESGTLPGLTRFQQRAMAAFQGTRKEAASLQDEIRRLAVSIDGLADAGTKAGGKMSQGFQQANSHALTNLDTVRLLRDDLGIRIPRAMEKLIASTQAFQAAASVAFGLLAGLGVAELIGHMGKEVYDLGVKWLSVTAARAAYDKQVQDNAQQKFVQVDNIEDAKLRIDEATHSAQTLNNIAKELAHQSWGSLLSGGAGGIQQALIERVTANQMSEQSVVGMDQQDKLSPEFLRFQHDQNRQQIELNHALDETHNRRQKINDDITKQKQLDAEDRAYQQRLNHLDPNPTSKDSGKSEQIAKDSEAEAKGQAELINLNEETQRELRRMRDETAAIGLKGEKALIAAQKTEIDSLSVKDDAYAQKKVEIERRTTAQIEQLHKEEARKTEELNEQSVLAGKTGNDRILEEERHTIYEINKLVNTSELTEEEAQRRRAAAHRSADAEIRKSLKDYADSERAMRDSQESSGSKGYLRIGADDHKERDDAEERYEKIVEGMDQTDERRLEAYRTYQAELVDISKKTDGEIKDLHDKNAEETRNLQDQASSVHTGGHGRGLGGMFDAEQAQTNKIVAEYNKRQRALDEMEKDGVLSHQEAVERKQAIDQLYNSQMEAAQASMRDKLTGEIEGAFKNPMAAIRKEMEHEMAAMIADWVMQLGAFKRIFGSTFQGTISGGAASGPGAQRAAGTGGLLSTIMGYSSTRGAGSPGGTAGSATGEYPLGGSVSASLASSSPSTSSPSTASPSDYSLGGAVSSTSSPGMSATSAVSDIGSLTTTSTRAYDALNPPSSPAVSGGVAQDNTGYVDAGNDPDQMPTYSAQDTSLLQPGASGASTAMGLAGQGIAGYAGFTGIVNAFEGGKGSDVLSGAMSGAELGGAVGTLAGPLGTAIGAGVGAAVGATAGLVGWATGEGNRLGAARYYKDTMRPQFQKSEKGYFDGTGGDIETAIANVTSIGQTGFQTMISKFGGTAATWAKSQYIDREQQFIIRQMDQVAGGGHDYTRASAVQFHTGGLISDFGDLSTSTNEGFIHAMLGEAVINPIAAGTHRSAISAMNSGASPSDIAGMYLRSGSGGGMTAPAGGVIHHHHYDISTMDAHSFGHFLEQGGMDTIAKHTTKRNTRYNGDSD